MKQLGNQDAGFVYNETPTTPMHIAGLGIYDQSTAPGGRLGHKDIINYVQDRIHLAPIFRYKYVEVPFSLDKPYWIEDPDFDIEFHIRHIALPQPGDWRQLCILASRLNSRPIDFSRPLWEAYIIEGLDNIEGLPKGSFAIMVKVHHSIVDGASGQAIFAALHDLSPDSTPMAPATPMTVDRKPTSAELIGRALPNLMGRPLSQTRSFYKKAPNLVRQAIRLYRGDLKSGAKLRVPQTRFNHSISPHRVFEGTYFPLEDIKYIKNTIGQGTTVNDVMLSIIGGGMRKYLDKHDELPEESMCAMLPQDIRTEETRDQQGNMVGGIFADIHTNVEDPIERLVSIHQSTDEAKHLAMEMDTAAVVQNYMGGFFNPRMGRRFNKLIQNSKVMERFGPFACNTLATNVPGPDFPLYHAGAQMVAYWGIPPLMDCLGLGHAIFSYCGRISLSAMACREMMPDPEFYVECIEEAYEEILTAAKDYEAEVKKAAVSTPAPKKRTARKSSAKATSSAKVEATAETAETASDKPAAKPARKRAASKASATSKPKAAQEDVETLKETA
ncbi:Putative diacyglycerol O-acyltransferase [BD1-7 clade bacterium]|uniref:diacylglycerol O-acyltransferase n=1 Tax=BD1-7 clade bacterium TaxID=2029982 RepID=A0A5S9QXE4_9GAMM|nr:Putative diacyglycerol O-acyltransferase [BD1-7 clade bacterium]